MPFLYNIFVECLILGMRVASLFDEKLKKGIEGRKRAFIEVEKSFTPNDKIIWMHASSLGEYEQGLPVLQELKTKFPECKILITFFSPSGYENVSKKTHIADVVCYLPFDRKKTIERFLSLFQTKIFITVKYDYWYLLLNALKHSGAKVFVVSALFYDRQVFFKSIGTWFVNELKINVDCFFHQTQESYTLAKRIGLDRSIVTGDTRFDRVKCLAKEKIYLPFIDQFKCRKTTVLFGSSWKSEERIAQKLLQQSEDLKIIIAPHDLKRVECLQKIFGEEAVLYSQSEGDFCNKRVLIIDSIGLLSRLYFYADLAVVGGGFHAAGLHNILEPIAFGVPVFFGNQYTKNPEADLLIAHGAAKSCSSEQEVLETIQNMMLNRNKTDEMSKNAKEFVEKQPYATDLIMKKIIG